MIQRDGLVEEGPKRQLWVDIAKTLALILVVVGHYATYAGYIYWFHMPAFFLLSGYLSKLPDDWSSFRSWLAKRSRSVLIPYCTYLVLVTLVRYYYAYRYLHVLEASFLWHDLPVLLLGGRLLIGYYTVFWFFICLFATQVLFASIYLVLKDNRLVIAAVAVAYLLAHVESWLMPSHPLLVPWDLDVALLAVAYYAIGDFCKKLLSNISPTVTLTAIFASILLITANYRGLFGYMLDMKNVVYRHSFLDLLIPVIMIIALLGISQMLARIRLGQAFTLLSNVAVPVVYLHVPINSVLRVEYHFHYGSTAAILIGFIVPVILSKLIFDRFSLTRFLLQGRVPPQLAAKTVHPLGELPA